MFLPAFDPLYLLFMIPPFLLGLVASLLLNYWTKQYLTVDIKNGITGLEVISKISTKENFNLRVNLIPEVLGESWDPISHTLNISQTNAHGRSVTGSAIIAHELGHVEQQVKGSLLFKIRTAIVPIVNFGSNLGYFLLIIGLILQLSELAWVGLAFFALTTVFTLITLPIELDASDRALKLLTRNQIVYTNELGGVKKVLLAAALTYVAALFQSLGQLMYFIFRIQGLSRRSD